MDFTSPLPGHALRVQVFLDYWNFTLLLRHENPDLWADYRILGPALARAALKTVDADARLDYQGMTVYGSYRGKERDWDLRRWFERISRFPGVSVETTRQQERSRAVFCRECPCRIEECPECGKPLRGYEEKGVDVRIATDLARLGWADKYDIGVLASSDCDFVPMVEFLTANNRKIVHAAFPPAARELSRKCWANFSVPRIRQDFRRNTEESRRA